MRRARKAAASVLPAVSSEQRANALLAGLRKPPTWTSAFGLMFLFAFAASAFACSPREHWTSQFATDFKPSGHTVSVFGVYRDGQMSTEAWSALRPRFEPVLGRRECEIAHDHSFAEGDSPLFVAVDDYARANGPTDDLLAQLSPAAEGDLILVLVEAGRLPAPEEKTNAVNSSAAAPGPNASGSQRSGLSTFAPKKHSGDGDPNVLQLSASLFSVAQGRSVALVDLRYSGDSVDDAIGEFTARVARLLPDTTCRGWNWHTDVDPERIRRLVQE
jgi:hypothetical protein